MYSGKLRSQKSTYVVDKSIHQHSLEMAGVTDMAAFADPQWGTQTLPLKGLRSKCESPIVIKITKGSFHNIGVTKNPLKRLNSEVLVHSVNNAVKVLGHSLGRFESRDGRARTVTLEQRLSIPISYQGWFELLSEDGRAAKPIDSVIRLAREFPNKCLVRQNIKGYIANEDGRLTFDKTKVIPAGDQLTLSGAVNIPGDTKRYLRCVDTKGVGLYLSFEQQGLFTPIAGPSDVSGVFTMKDILTRFRLPLTVKLVMGVFPKVDPSKFTGVIRLDWAYTDDTAFICPIDPNNLRITPVPTEIPLKFTPCTNMSDLQEGQTYKDVMIKCNKMVSNYNNTIHLIVAIPESVKKKKTHDIANALTQQTTNNNNNNIKSQLKRSRSKEDVLMDEMDDLYQYLREGKCPPKHKYTYDSDEESYFEEPAYEPLDDFRAKLALLDKGKQIPKNSKYRPASGLYKGDENSPRHKNSDASLDIPDFARATDSKKSNPPPLPPRRYQRHDSAPMIRVQCNQGNQDSSSGSSRGELHRITSVPVMERKSSMDSTGSANLAAKDSGSSRTSSSGKRYSMQPTLYL